MAISARARLVWASDDARQRCRLTYDNDPIRDNIGEGGHIAAITKSSSAGGCRCFSGRCWRPGRVCFIHCWAEHISRHPRVAWMHVLCDAPGPWRDDEMLMEEASCC